MKNRNLLLILILGISSACAFLQDSAEGQFKIREKEAITILELMDGEAYRDTLSNQGKFALYEGERKQVPDSCQRFDAVLEELRGSRNISMRLFEEDVEYLVNECHEDEQQLFR